MGVGYWVQEIYYHLLNCGLRVAPSAGSASGVLPNPVGYNRVYVHLPEDRKTCAGVTRIYRVEGERMIFEQELIDI